MAGGSLRHPPGVPERAQGNRSRLRRAGVVRWAVGVGIERGSPGRGRWRHRARVQRSHAVRADGTSRSVHDHVRPPAGYHDISDRHVSDSVRTNRCAGQGHDRVRHIPPTHRGYARPVRPGDESALERQRVRRNIRHQATLRRRFHRRSGIVHREMLPALHRLARSLCRPAAADLNRFLPCVDQR